MGRQRSWLVANATGTALPTALPCSSPCRTLPAGTHVWRQVGFVLRCHQPHRHLSEAQPNKALELSGLGALAAVSATLLPWSSQLARSPRHQPCSSLPALDGQTASCCTAGARPMAIDFVLAPTREEAGTRRAGASIGEAAHAEVWSDPSGTSLPAGPVAPGNPMSPCSPVAPVTPGVPGVPGSPC